MANHTDIQIKGKKKNILFILIPSIYFTFRFCRNIYQEIVINNSGGLSIIFNVILNFIMAGLFCYIAVYAIQRFLDKSPGLIINKLGIFDNSGLVSAGMIFWIDIVEINTSKIVVADCIGIKVKKPERYINNQKHIFKKLWLMFENKHTGSPVNISLGGLKIKYNELFSIMQQRFLATQVDSRTSELRREKDVIQQEKTELVDSINYAKRIQSALLPSSENINKRLGESFILYLPKSIVSGDFYWVESVDEWVFFAACDCTGHGVPGALMSIVCNNALNRAIKEYNLKLPAAILDKVAELITESISSYDEVQDGMDASVCSFNKNTRELFWAGANIPLWIARENGLYELIEFKPDKQPIGIFKNRFPYTNHQIEIHKNDILYLSSDGFADQFGGDFNKKFTRKKFKELLLLQRGKTMEDQRINLLTFHNNYKHHNEQIDDILIMGIKIEK